MTGLENKDASFFTIESPDITLPESSFEKYLISLSIEESMGALSAGSLTFYDPNNYFSRVLRTGVRLIISWGYKRTLAELETLGENQFNLDEVSGQLARRGYLCFVNNPSGGGDANGVITYNCNFTTSGFQGEELSQVYTQGTKKSVVDDALDNLGISRTNRFVNFTLGSDSVTTDKGVRQDESTFAFLNRLSIEWKALFYVAYGANGKPVAVFIDRNVVGKTPLPLWVMNATGGSNALGYKGKLSNVISWRWSSSESEKGVGDHVSAEIVDGQIQYRQYVATQEKVITWRLDNEKIQTVFDEAGADGIAAQLQLTQDLLDTKTFDEVKHYFTPFEDTTAPTGYGYRLSCEMIGNPLMMPGSAIKLINGFPDRLGGGNAKWFVQSVSHRIDSAGYTMKVEITDVFNLSPIGLPVL